METPNLTLSASETSGPSRRLRLWQTVALAVGAVVSFHLAFMVPALCWLVLAYLGCLFALRRLATARQAFYFGLAIGLGVFVPQMGFLWTIFQAAAIPLWLILALFHAAFLLLLNRVDFRLGTKWAVILAPVLWCGIEYFRSEVWWLRFAWFTAGSVFDGLVLAIVGWLGVYGIGCAVMALNCIAITAWNSARKGLHLKLLAIAALFAIWWFLPTLMSSHQRHTTLRIAGLQLEFPAVPDVLTGLDKLAKAHPEAGLLMLSEYTFADGPPPPSVKAWCQRNGKWLVVGGKQPIEPGSRRGDEADSPAHAPLRLLTSAATKERFYNTAFVISTNGDVVFTQAKSRPIQFFADGEPAPSQRVWDSPWGKLGIAICYDASYRQVTDGLIRQGAVALLIPTMDVEQWGEYQHRLNARMARLRAAEYRVPIFRVASSGISQIIDRTGREIATAPFPGQGEMIAGELRWTAKGGTVPLDEWLAPACTWATGGVMLWLGALAWRDRRNRKAAR
jgi:apolipoprotein N-acyltransferase